MGNDKKILRIPITFDATDEKQKMVYDVLKNAGYGQRTPLIMKAMCLLLGEEFDNPPKQEEERSGVSLEMSDSLIATIRKATEDALWRCLPEVLNAFASEAPESVSSHDQKAPSKFNSSDLNMDEADMDEALSFVDMF